MGTEEVGTGGRGRYRYPRAARLRRRSEIRALLRRGKRRRTDHLDVFVKASSVQRFRVALVIPKHRHKIVERNRVKRHLRECVRLELLPRCYEGGVALDVLVRARAETYMAGYEVLKTEIRELAEQLCSHGSS